MSIRDINPFDWYRGLFNSRIGTSLGEGFFENISREFDEIQKSFYDQIKNLQNTAPKDLVREYETSDGSKVREVGPIVYGYSMNIGPDGKPQIREFGNVKSPFSGRGLSYSQQQQSFISPEREPLVDVATTEKHVKIVAEMPGVKKEDIKINVYDNSVEITTNDPQRKYHKIIEIPNDIDTETAKSTYHNGILEIILNKRKETKPKGKEIKIE
ncbi:MAG: archaeal heat shock protein Hsp20 [Nitrososphaeraceae archaeon]